MRVIPLEIDVAAHLALLQRKRSEVRSKGRHLSEIIKYALIELYPQKYGDTPIDPAQAAVGFLWEEVLSDAFAQELGWRQIEVEDDGILMTLDGFRQGRVQEAKATKISAANPISGSRFWHWHVQIKAYCRAARVTEAELWSLFINGGYELGGGRFGMPVVRPVRLVFSKQEIEENWRMVLKVRDRMEERK